MRKWLLLGVVSSLFTCLSACNARVQTPASLTSPSSPLVTSPLAPPTVTIDEKTISPLLTAQAQLTLEPTPVTPNDARMCMATDLMPGEGSMGGATQHDFVYLPITNTSHIGCILQPPVKVQLVDAQGKALPVDYSPPLATAKSPSGEPLKLYIRPGEAVMFMFDWGNWCTPFKQTQLIARANLAGDNALLNIPLNFPFFYGHCFSPHARSTLSLMFVVRIPQ
jgi:hypothetical protein